MKKNSPVVKAIGIAVFLLFISSHFSFGQEIKTFDLRFTVATGPKKYLKQLDSVTLRNEITREEWIFDNMQTRDSIFTIEEVELGKYRIVVYQKGMVIPFADFSTCTLCKNTVRLNAYTTTANKVFDRVWIGPYYEKGFKQLASDFLSGITKEEKKILKDYGKKLKLKCFITADRRLSDVIYEPADLPAETKAIIQKGLDKCKAWIAAITDGKPFDDYIPLTIAKIVD